MKLCIGKLGRERGKEDTECRIAVNEGTGRHHVGSQ